MKTNWLLAALLLVALIDLVNRPAKVYSFSPQVFPTGIEVDESVNASGSGLKHIRETPTSGCVPQQSSCNFLVNWPGTPFPDANYSAVCAVSGGNAFVVINGKSTTQMSVTVVKTTINQSETLSLNCIAMHD